MVRLEKKMASPGSLSGEDNILTQSTGPNDIGSTALVMAT